MLCAMQKDNPSVFLLLSILCYPIVMSISADIRYKSLNTTTKAHIYIR